MSDNSRFQSTEELLLEAKARILAGHEEGIQWPAGTVEIDSHNDSLAYTLFDYGDLTITLTLQDQQWVVMTDIVPVSDVADTTSINQRMLEVGLLIPLVSVGITTIEGSPHYVVYGQLYHGSKWESLCAEVNACAEAAIEIASMIHDQAA